MQILRIFRDDAVDFWIFMATNARMILFYKCKYFPQIARIFTDDAVDFWVLWPRMDE